MDDSERRTAKRSRFDQTEPEPRRSRFDRRSRSPPTKRSSEPGRDRSPLGREGDNGVAEPKKASVDPAAAAGMYTYSRTCPFLKIPILSPLLIISMFSCRRRQDQCSNPGEERCPTCRCTANQVCIFCLTQPERCELTWRTCFREHQWRDVHCRRRLYQGHRSKRLAKSLPTHQEFNSEDGKYRPRSIPTDLHQSFNPHAGCFPPSVLLSCVRSVLLT